MFDKKYADETGKIIGAAIEVHNHLGTGFQKVIYQWAMSYEFELQNIPFLTLIIPPHPSSRQSPSNTFKKSQYEEDTPTPFRA